MEDVAGLPEALPVAEEISDVGTLLWTLEQWGLEHTGVCTLVALGSTAYYSGLEFWLVIPDDGSVVVHTRQPEEWHVHIGRVRDDANVRIVNWLGLEYLVDVCVMDDARSALV
jgi:hypothetical protein